MPATEQRISKREPTFDREAVLCAHRLDVDDDVFEILTKHSEPLVDTPNTVLRRLLGIDQAESRPAPIRDKASERARRAARGTLLPASEYEIQILRYLDECGGWAPAREAIEAVGRALDGKLTEVEQAATQVRQNTLGGAGGVGTVPSRPTRRACQELPSGNLGDQRPRARAVDVRGRASRSGASRRGPSSRRPCPAAP